MPKDSNGMTEKWIWILDPEELADLEEKKRKEKEEELKRLRGFEKGNKNKPKPANVGLADWEGADDHYDAKADLGEFDAVSALKSTQKPIASYDKNSLAHLVDQRKKEIESNVGRKKVSGWLSLIGWGGGSASAASSSDKKKTRATATAESQEGPPDDDHNGALSSNPDTLRKLQKNEALKASGFDGKKKGGASTAANADSHIPLAPSHVKAPSMPPPASVLRTAAGAIQFAPAGIMPPKGPPPKSSKSTVEEKYIKAVWNMDDVPMAPSHIKPPPLAENSWLLALKKRYGSMSQSLQQKYEIIMSIGKMYHYDAKVIAHPRAMELAHIACRSAWVKFVEGAKAAHADTGKRALREMDHDLTENTARRFVAIQHRIRYNICMIEQLKDEVKKHKSEYASDGSSRSVERGLQWLSAKSTNIGDVIRECTLLEDLLRKEVQKRNGFLPIISIVPMVQLTQRDATMHDLHRLGVPLDSMYPTEHDLLKTTELYEAKIVWFMSEEGGTQRSTEEGLAMTGEGRVGSQALFALVVYRDLIRFTPLGKRLSKQKSAALDRAEKLIEEEERGKDEVEMKLIRTMNMKDAKKAMRKRKVRIMKRLHLKQKGNGYVRVPGDVKVKLLCSESAEGKKTIEVAIAGYVEAVRTKQYHKRAFLLERALKFMSESLGVGRIVEALPLHIDSLCIIPQGPMRLAPLHALPILTKGGSQQYRGETLMDRYTIRYCSSMVNSDFCEQQALWARDETPWHYRKLCVIADPVPSHAPSTGEMRLALMEGKIVRDVWSSDADDVSALFGKDAHSEVALNSKMEGGGGNDVAQMIKKNSDKISKKKKRRRGGPGKARVMVSEGVWEDVEISSSSDSSSDGGNSDDEGSVSASARGGGRRRRRPRRPPARPRQVPVPAHRRPGGPRPDARRPARLSARSNRVRRRGRDLLGS